MYIYIYVRSASPLRLKKQSCDMYVYVTYLSKCQFAGASVTKAPKGVSQQVEGASVKGSSGLYRNGRTTTVLRTCFN